MRRRRDYTKERDAGPLSSGTGSAECVFVLAMDYNYRAVMRDAARCVGVAVLSGAQIIASRQLVTAE